MMADLLEHPELRPFVLSNVRLTGTRVGSKAYGSVTVEEAEIHGVVCAVLRDSSEIPTAEISKASTQFVKECQMISTLRHPHIVQFLGVCSLQGSRLPALVMELMLTSLHELLVQEPDVGDCEPAPEAPTPFFPLGLKRSILHDVARGLAYLHGQSPPIIHRDLSARNVLLNSAMVAKIADVGVSRIAPPTSPVYMPPEVLEAKVENGEDSSKYEMSIDIFSFGVVAIFTLCQTFPCILLAPKYRERLRHMVRTELERRDQYMQKIYSQLRKDHPLVQMIEGCLHTLAKEQLTIREVLWLLEQARAEIRDEESDMHKLELVRALQRQPRNQIVEEDHPSKVGEKADLQQQLSRKEAELKIAEDTIRKEQQQNQELKKQLKTTSCHIHNMFTVPQGVSETRRLIEEQKHLEAYNKLSELEQTRDELLMLLYQEDKAIVDENVSVHHYFEELIVLSESLRQTLWMTMYAVTRLMVEAPQQVITTLYIVEREERMDEKLENALALKCIPPSQIPGRPKHWKNKCMEILVTSISNRFEELAKGTTSAPPRERTENQDWLTDHLKEVERVCSLDLKAIVTGGEKCFPPSYKIVSLFVTRYHHGLVNEISRLTGFELNVQEIITLMTWIEDIKQSFAEAAAINLTADGPLLPPDKEDELLKVCCGKVQSNVRALMGNLLKTEQKEWNGKNPPESDIKGKLYTPVGVNLFQIVEQNITTLSPLGPAARMKILFNCLECLQEFQRNCRGAIDEYNKKASAGKLKPPCFILYVIAIGNDCASCVEFTEQLKLKFCLEMNEAKPDKMLDKGFKKVTEEFADIGHHCCDILMEMVFTDLKPVLDGLMTRDKWFNHPLNLITMVEGTMLDYNEDFSKLKPAYHTYVIVQCQQRVMNTYMEALCSKKMVLKKDNEREKVGDCVIKESKKLNSMFLSLSDDCNPELSQVLKMMGAIIKSDKKLLPLEISNLASKHREIKMDHMMALLAMRGDMNTAQATKMLNKTLPQQAGTY